jgi:DNA-binding NarL/FixJ family response regulator
VNGARENRIAVVVVEDDDSIRAALELILNGSSDFRCAGTFPDAESALRGIPSILPDAVLMDIQLPGQSGIDCVRALKRSHANLQFVMVTVFEDDDLVFKSLAAGAVGYLLKSSPPAEILKAIAEVHAGGSPMSSYIARKVVQSFHRVRSPSLELEALSPREQELLGYLAKGFLYKEIADRMDIRLDTVRSHIRRVYEKLHAHSRTEAVKKFVGF